MAGVRLVIGDHYSGLVKAIWKVMLGSGHQRCRVHFLRNVFGVISKETGEMVADMLGAQFPKVKAMLLEAEPDQTAFAACPERHWKKIQSTNLLERVNREIKPRIDVVQVHPNDDALRAWSARCCSNYRTNGSPSPRRYLPEGSMEQLCPAEPPDSTPVLPDTTSG